MRPGNFQNRFIFLRIKSFTLRVDRRWDRAKQILAKHVDYSGVHWFCDDGSIVRDIVEEFMQCQPLDLLRFHVSSLVIEIEYNIALVDLLHEQFLSAIGGYFVETRQFLKFSLTLIRYVKS